MPVSRLTAAAWQTPLTRPRMSNEVDRHERVAMTSRHLTLDGRPWLPISGEMHYSRVPRRDWRERLLLLKASGVDVVSTYVIWLHHEPVRGRATFDGELDLRAFIELCAELELLVALRIGPWVHSEARNGGFPDWVQELPVQHRTDDPAYLDVVRGWYAHVADAVGDLCGPTSPIVAIQLENELYDQPQHLATLKSLAREAGLSTPIWTATAWGGADLPPDEVLPVWSGYGDGFWVDHDSPWHPTFRAHFRMSHEWDDPGTGADVRGVDIDSVATKDVDPTFPVATCELGGGMATAYHRRPVLLPLDVPAVANAKLGSGSAWQGYYMYVGGTNPEPGMQESQATGYPNDLPEFDYDFQAPIGAAGSPGPAMAGLRLQHAFVEAFDEWFAPMPAAISPDDAPRWSLRSDGRSGVVFVNWHQPHIPLPAIPGVRLEVGLDGETVVLGHAPLDIPPGTVARWPVNVDVDGVTVRWATASLLTRNGDGLFLVAEPGIPAQVAFAAGAQVTGDGLELEQGVWELTDGGRLHIRDGDAAVDVHVIAAHDAARLWVLGAERRVVRSDEPVWIDGGRLVVRTSGRPRVDAWRDGAWVGLDAGTTRAPSPVVLATGLVRDAGEAPASYGSSGGRAAAPTGGDWDAAARWGFKLPDPLDGGERLLEISWAGDVARLVRGGEVVADRFYDQTPWLLDVEALPGTGDELVLEILPLHPEALVWLPPAAADRRDATAGPLLALDQVAVRHTRSVVVG